MPAVMLASLSDATSHLTRRPTVAFHLARRPRWIARSRSSRRCLARSRPRARWDADRFERVKEDSTMSLSRRRFVRTVGTGAAGLWIASRGREAALFDPGYETVLRAQGTSPMILDSNENPNGPGKTVLDAVRAAFGALGPYQKLRRAVIGQG